MVAVELPLARVSEGHRMPLQTPHRLEGAGKKGRPHGREGVRVGQLTQPSSPQGCPVVSCETDSSHPTDPGSVPPAQMAH